MRTENLKKMQIKAVCLLFICFVSVILLGKIYIKMQENPNDYVQINQTDYTKMNYKDGYYYYQSSADHFYLYKADVTGSKMECLAQQVPKEIYVIDDWIYFTNASDGQTLYRIHTDGSGMEQVLQQEIARLVPMGDGFYYLSQMDGYLYEWREDKGSRLLHEENCIRLGTYGEMLYVTEREEGEKNYSILSVDRNGRIISRYDGCGSRIIPTEQYLYYVENSNVMCISLEDGKKKKIAEIPIETEYEDVIDYSICGENFYVLCYQPEEAYVIYQYKILTDTWEKLYEQPLENTDWIYKGFDDFQIVNKKIFMKEWSSEGKGELWYWLDIETGAKAVFEDMEPFRNITEPIGDVFYGATQESLVYLDEDYVFDEILEDGEGNLIDINMVIPQVNENIKAYQEINRKIQKDAEDFYYEQMEFSEYIKDAAAEWENESAGCWEYVYLYADSDYVSIVYWKFIGRNGLSDVKCDQYEVRLYSSETGEEIGIEDLFCADKEEILLRFSYAIRKTKSGLRLFHDDLEMLERHDSDYRSMKSYYLLTEEGIDVFFVERVRTKIDNYIISYEELEDILR